MTFTVAPQPSNLPPRIRLDVNTDDPSSPFTSLTIKRDGKTIREAPFTGSDAALAFDYEAPFGVPVTYTAVGTKATLTTVYTTSWANLTGWTVTQGSPGVAGGKLYSTTAASARVTRPIAALTSGRLMIAAGMTGHASLSLPTSAGTLGVQLNVTATTANVSWGGSSVAVDVGTTGIDIVFGPSGATITTSVGVYRLPVSSDPASTFLYLSAWVQYSAGRLPGFTLKDATPAAFSATASTQLDASQAWLIHPSQPSLSCAIDNGPAGGSAPRFIEGSSGDTKTSSAASTVHRPDGRKRAVVITSGPRAADEWVLVVGAETITAKNAIRALVDDQTPLLLRSPAGAGWDLPDDWYSVGDVQVIRSASPAANEFTRISLPLIPVDEPIVRQGALWSWGSVLLNYATWQDVLDDNATWLDVLAGPTA